MKFQIIDRRDADKRLKKNKIIGKPVATVLDSSDQRIINFVKKLSIKPIETDRISNLSSKAKVTRYITNKFLAENPNLKHRYGIIFSIIDRFFDYDIVDEQPKKEEPKVHKQLELNFEQFYNRLFEKYRN